MTPLSIPVFLKEHGLRDTQPRRLVIEALQAMSEPASPYDIQKWISSEGDAINTVTVYRVLALLEGFNLVHKHPCNGLYSLCSMPGKKGHHGFLHCEECGETEEFSSSILCTVENAIARKAGFKSQSHVSEIVGMCHRCR